MKTILPVLTCALLAGMSAAQSSLVVPTGTTFVYDTASGPLILQELIIEPGGVMRVEGVQPFKVLASGFVRIDGLLDLSGFDNPGVGSLNSSNLPERGAVGGPGGGRGGTGSPLTTQTSPNGTNGFGPPAAPRTGGRGGESGTNPSSYTDGRRPGGGGGGVLAIDQPVHIDPNHVSNIGLISQSGFDGWPTALGVRTQMSPPTGGGIGESPFLDSDRSNDFFGRELDPMTGTIKVGELAAPVAGSGGGGGGDAVNGFVGPPHVSPVFFSTDDEKGSGGGGGGGMGIVISPLITVGIQGKIRCDGGKGGGGENTNFLDRVGGGSGGGSGGYLVLQARRLDMSASGDRALTALGGRGGPGKDNSHGAINAGGNGGPGVIAIHVPPVDGLLLPVGKTLADLSAPKARVLLPDRRF